MTDRTDRFAVIVVSKGRPDILQQMIFHINAQILRPVLFILSVTEEADADFDLDAMLHPAITGERIIAPPGICRQRNAALDRIGPGIDHVVFYDDDFFPSAHALDAIATGFARHEDVDGITGKLLADGIGGHGIGPEAARAMLRDWDSRQGAAADRQLRITRDTFGLYGCNMAFRARAIEGLRFDERLPVYGWQEDVDFASQLRGRKVEMEGVTGVHLGVRSGRETIGQRLGYSQVVNPYYLWRKGTLSAGFALSLVSGNLLANHAKALRPEPWLDRRGRLRGNWAGLRDVLRGRADPGRIMG